MSIGGRTFRAFRASYFALSDDSDNETQQVKQDRIRLYIQRADAGLSLFEAADFEPDMSRSGFAVI